jgi:D-alanyl-D-alanine-carboxypeptidase/D-alanyl-D-alanine-endopeptidase
MVEAPVLNRRAPAMTSWTLPSDAEIGDILRARIDFQGQGVGIVVGVIDAGGRRVVSHGALAKSDARPLNGETLFENGSITKAFTSLLL